MSKPEPMTPLIALMRACTPEERALLAQWSGTPESYLYALGGCSRKSCRTEKAAAIEDASRQLNRRTNGRTPVVTMRELATMCLTR